MSQVISGVIALIATLRNLLNQGMSGDQILTTMQITRAKFERLHYKLIQMDNQPYPVTFASSGRPIKVGGTGNITTPAHQVNGMGLGPNFPPGTRVKFERSGNGILITALP